jgi:uncharacterized protein (TIGR03086 family)
METNQTITHQQPTTEDAPYDPRPLLGIALSTGLSVVTAISADQRSLPTPCAEFDVRTLAGHLIGVLERISVMARGGDIDDVPFVLDVLDEQWGASWKERATAAEAAWASDALLTTPIHLPWATLPGFAALTMYVNEVTVHSWDLATATGQTPHWDAAVLATSYGFMQQGLPADEAIRNESPFDAVVAVPDTAPMIDRLVAWNGRNPAWHP